MAKKDSAIETTEQEYTLDIFAQAEHEINVSAMLDQMGFNSPKVALKSMSDRSFRINLMRMFVSKINQQPAFFCLCEDYETKERFQTVIGCAAGLDILLPAFNQGIRSGLVMRFEYIPTGDDRGYYKLS